MIVLVVLYGLAAIAAGMAAGSFLPVGLWLIATTVGWCVVTVRSAFLGWVKAKTS